MFNFCEVFNIDDMCSNVKFCNVVFKCYYFVFEMCGYILGMCLYRIGFWVGERD